ncbi:hypothetical protein BGW41_000761 [Actinomortierella wolfii]|nr:hypothetical protein BGW41_000761 [Actinomortierella wolfii]
MLSLEAHDGASTVDVDSVTTPRHSEEYCHQPKPCIARLDRDDSDFTSGVRRECLQENNMDEVADYNCSSHSMASLGDQLSGQANDYSNPPISPRRATPDSRSRTFPTASIMDEHNMDNIRSYTHNDHQHRRSSRNRSLFVRNQQSSTLQEPEQRAFGHGKSTSSSSSRSASSIFVPPGHSHTNTLGPSSLSSWMGRQEWSPSAILAKEKELAIQQTKLLALSSLAESVATNSSQAKQGFYGKQLKLIGKISPSGGAADFEMIVKLLPSSTLLQQWEVLEQHLKPDTEGSESAKTAPASSTSSPALNTTTGRDSDISDIGEGEDESLSSEDKTEKNPAKGVKHDAMFEFKVHPSIVSLEEAYLNPDSDEDAQFWLAAQELVAQGRVVEKLLDALGEKDNAGAQEEDGHSASLRPPGNWNQIAGCFQPSSSLHISWMPKNACKFVTNVQQEVHVHLTTKVEPPTITSSLFTGQKRRQNPEEDVQLLVSSDDDEDDEEEEEDDDDESIIGGLGRRLVPAAAAATNSNVALLLESSCTLTVRKLGWKLPFVDVQIHGLPASIQETLLEGKSKRQETLKISGEAVQDWENISPVPGSQEPIFRISLFSGTEGQMIVRVILQVDQLPPTRLTKAGGALLTIPKIEFLGAHEIESRIRIVAGDGLYVRPASPSLQPIAMQDWPLEDCLEVAPQGAILQYYYSQLDPEKLLSVYTSQYQSIARIERIERVHVDLGMSELSKPAYVHVQLHDVVVGNEAGFLRVSNLEGVEIWSVRVNGIACTRNMEAIDTYKRRGERFILIPIPQHQSGGTAMAISDRYDVEFSYGFMPRVVSSATAQESRNDADMANQGCQQQPQQGLESLHLIIPGFDLPVGKYLVSAHLPRLPSSLTYGEPLGELRTLSYSGGRVPLFSPSPSFTRTSPLENEFFDPSIPLLLEKRATVYGVFMSNGLPELKIPLVPVATPPAITSAPLRVNETTEPERQLAQQQSTRPLNTADSGPAAISAASTLMHPPLHAHDPQQPPPGTQQSRRTLFHSHQRHPQETYHPPPFSSNRSRLPEAYEAYSSNDEDDMSPTTTQTISLQAPSIIRPGDPLATANSEDLHARAAGSPSITRVVGPAAISEEETTRRKTSPLNRLRDRNQYRGGDTIRDPPKFWWRQIVVVLVSLAMVILLLNAASFQDLGLSPFISWNASFERIMSTWWKPSTLEQALPRGIEGTRIKESATGGSVTSAATKSTENTNPTTIEKVTMATPTVATTSAKVSEGGGRMVTKEKVENLQRDEQIVRATLTAQTEYKSGDSRLPFSSTSTTLYPMPVQQQAEGKEREPGMMDKAKGVFRRAIDSAVRWWRRQWMVLISRKRIEAGTSEKEGRE